MTAFEDWKVFLQQFDKLENQYNNVYHLLEYRDNQYKELQVENKDLQKVVEEKGQLLVKMEEYWKGQYEAQAKNTELWKKQADMWQKEYNSMKTERNDYITKYIEEGSKKESMSIFLVLSVVGTIFITVVALVQRFSGN